MFEIWVTLGNIKSRLKISYRKSRELGKKDGSALQCKVEDRKESNFIVRVSIQVLNASKNAIRKIDICKV